MAVHEWTPRNTQGESNGIITVKKFYRTADVTDEDAAYSAIVSAAPLTISQGGETLVRSNVSIRATGDSGDIWEASVTWSNNPPDNQGGTQDPLSRPARFGIRVATESRAYFNAKDPDTGDDVSVLNSAGAPFETLLQKLVPRGTVTVNFTQLGSPYNWTRSIGKINSGTFTLDGSPFDPYTMMLVSADVTTEYQGFTKYYDVTLEFAYDEDEWVDSIEDRGTEEVVEFEQANGDIVRTYRPILDAFGNKTEKPWPLDGTGKALPNVDDVPATLRFRPYRAVAFPDIN